MIPISSYGEMYRDELLNEIVPFWTKYSVDWEHGGYFTCLDEQGKIYDTDKFMWPQCRQAYIFSRMYLDINSNSQWLEIATNGINFLEKYGRNSNGDWYFALNREGAPLVQPYNIFSDCFAVLAFYAYGTAVQDQRYIQISLDTFKKILQRVENPKGIYNKMVSGTRPQKGFALPMILCNICMELRNSLPESLVEKTINRCIDEIFKEFYDPQTKVIREYVLVNGDFFDHFDGRLVNPGHGIEAMWFVMEIADFRHDDQLFMQAAKILMELLEFGWDTKYGGIFYFLDVAGNPPQQLEWDQKLWWVHLETLIGLAKAYEKTKQPKFAAAFNKVHDYTWSHFRDLENQGEWFGYLNRRGELLLRLKGGKWKGCFHVPRALFKVWQALKNSK